MDKKPRNAGNSITVRYGQIISNIGVNEFGQHGRNKQATFVGKERQFVADNNDHYNVWQIVWVALKERV